MSDEKCCCNCLHCARWKTSRGIECHCDLDDNYLGYLEVMDIDNHCRKWEKETKWDIQAEHDKQIIEDTIDEVISKCSKEYQSFSRDYMCKIWLDDLEKLKKGVDDDK